MVGCATAYATLRLIITTEHTDHTEFLCHCEGA